MPEQNVSTLSYPRTVTTTTQTTLETEYRHSYDSTNGNKQIIQQYLTLDPDAVAQVSTVTLTIGTVGQEYAVTVTADGTTRIYRHKQVAGDTVAAIAAFLATLIDTNPNVQATSAAGVITITGVVPGASFTLANIDSTVPANVVIATTTAAAGTPKHRKRWEIALTFSVKPNGFESISADGYCYDGAALPTALVRFGPLVLSDAPRSLSQIQTEQS